MDSSSPMTCVNCQMVTTNDGRTVWVCERCGTENATPTAQAADVAAAQAAISAAADQAAGIPAEPVVSPSLPPQPATPEPIISSFAAPPVSEPPVSPAAPAAQILSDQAQ